MYSGYPSAESEKAWARLWDCKLDASPDNHACTEEPQLVGAFSVPIELLGGLNKSSLVGDFRLVDPDHGGGVGGLLEGAHQIHCLVSSTVSRAQKTWANVETS